MKGAENLKIPFACAVAGGVVGIGGIVICMLTPVFALLFWAAPTGVVLCAVFGWEFGVRWNLRGQYESDYRLNANAVLSAASSIGGLVSGAVIGLIVAVQPKGTFHEQGGMIITLLVLPIMFALWIVAGPVALVAGRRAATMRPSIDSKAGHPVLARVGYILGLVTTVCGVGGVWYFVLAVVLG